MDRRAFIGASSMAVAGTALLAQHAVAQAGPPAGGVPNPERGLRDPEGGLGNQGVLAEIERRLVELESRSAVPNSLAPEILGYGAFDDTRAIPGPGFAAYGQEMSVERAGSGVIRVRLFEAISEPPIVLATSSSFNRIGSPLINVFVTSVTTGGFSFETFENGRAANASFNFLVLRGTGR